MGMHPEKAMKAQSKKAAVGELGIEWSLESYFAGTLILDF